MEGQPSSDGPVDLSGGGGLACFLINAGGLGPL